MDAIRDYATWTVDFIRVHSFGIGPHGWSRYVLCSDIYDDTYFKWNVMVFSLYYGDRP